VIDTAPTGHTLRLLELPIDWSRQLEVKIYATVDSAAADEVVKRRFGAIIEMMRDPSRCTFVFVMHPESTPVVEAHRAALELGSLGIHPGLVVANEILPDEACTTPFGRSRRAMQEKYLSEIARRFPVPVMRIPLLQEEVRGLAMLARLGEQVLAPIGGHGTLSVDIVGAPLGCDGDAKDSWRRAAAWVGTELERAYGGSVRVRYFDLFDPGCPRLPGGASLPVVLVAGEAILVGKKISLSAIRKHLDDLSAKSGGDKGLHDLVR